MQKIKYVFETHFHADFVSGHIDLSRKTNAPIVYGPTANPDFEAHIAKDGEEFKVGKVSFKVLHTPGHTMESTSYLLRDENGKDTALFSGDTLFIGDVGRPDLAQKATNMTQEELAATLFYLFLDLFLLLASSLKLVAFSTFSFSFYGISFGWSNQIRIHGKQINEIY